MANESTPLKAYDYNGYTITFRNGQWTAIKDTRIQYSHKDEAEVKRWVSNH